MPRAEGRPLTPTDVAHHLACQHRTQLRRQQHEGTLPDTFTPDARLEAMLERGLAHERAYLEQLRNSGLRIVDLRATRDPARTLAAMQDGAEVLVQAPFDNGSFRGTADILRRCNTPSALGDYSYEPIDTKLAAETKAGALLQLLTYCELLAGLQGTMPARFYVVTPRTMQEPEPYRTAEYAAYFRVIRDHLQQAAAPPSRGRARIRSRCRTATSAPTGSTARSSENATTIRRGSPALSAGTCASCSASSCRR